MSWCTGLRTNIEFNRVTFKYKFEVEEAIKHQTAYAQDILWDIVRQNINLTSIEFRELAEKLEDTFVQKYKLELLLRDWDKCHASDGSPICSEKPWNKDPEIYGDFIDEEFLCQELIKQ